MWKDVRRSPTTRCHWQGADDEGSRQAFEEEQRRQWRRWRRDACGSRSAPGSSRRCATRRRPVTPTATRAGRPRSAPCGRRRGRPTSAASVGELVASVGRHQDHHRGRSLGQEAARRLDAVHAREVDVHHARGPAAAPSARSSASSPEAPHRPPRSRRGARNQGGRDAERRLVVDHDHARAPSSVRSGSLAAPLATRPPSGKTSTALTRRCTSSSGPRSSLVNTALMCFSTARSLSTERLGDGRRCSCPGHLRQRLALPRASGGPGATRAAEAGRHERVDHLGVDHRAAPGHLVDRARRAGRRRRPAPSDR